MRETTSPPGAAWLAIVGQPTLSAFASAFSVSPILEATVLTHSLIDIRDIYQFFCTTRSMYDRIAFVDETRSATRFCLEWEGLFQGEAVSGATILSIDETGAIERVRIFHFPHQQLNDFSAELARRHSVKISPDETIPGSPS